MRSKIVLASLITISWTISSGARPAHADDELLGGYVNPFIGTANSPTFNTKTSDHGGSGNTYPGATVPFGMVQFGPDTDHPGRLDYRYDDTGINGFSLTHVSGVGCVISNEHPGLPMIQPSLKAEPLAFQHSNERTAPGYYAVRFDNGIDAELTATPRTGFAKFHFPETAQEGLTLIAPFNSYHFIDPLRISGSVEGGNFCNVGNSYTVYYAIQFDSPVESTGASEHSIALRFEEASDKTLRVKIAISFVSEKNAWTNLATENSSWDFGDIKQFAANHWEQALGKIRVSGTGPGQSGLKKMFYSALYHSLLHPNIYSDVNGEYEGFDRRTHTTANGHIQYANFSSWDVYRTQIQLVSVLFPDRASDMMESLVNDAAQCGALPRWAYNNDETSIMVGDPTAIVVANAYAFGAKDFEASKALEFMEKSGTDPAASCNGHLTRPGLTYYLNSGYIPLSTAGVWGSAATTLEYSASDYAISRYAQSLGEPAVAQRFLAQSANWRNLFDPASQTIRPRDKSGVPLANFGPASQTGFVEGNAIQYAWSVPHDLNGLIRLSGGPTAVIKRLNAFFGKLNVGERFPYLWIGNEPGFNTPWTYDWTPAPYRTQEVLHRILTQEFNIGPGGLPGNDDLGALSAWYVWASLGLYPSIPGVAGFAVSTPSFPKIDLQLESGRIIHLRSDKKSDASFYIQSASLGDTTLDKPWISWADLVSAGELDFELGEQPNFSNWSEGN
ncbi:MAG: GH92 family glycosyl hydrolase [Oligoflexia bacterium]|nr:GH92 family glycosyl hydrolase [Oligoflexia bacterium]